MKKITRALAAVLLCALLMLCAPFAAAMEGVTGAQVQIWLADGSTQALPVQIVTTSLGDVVYWVEVGAMALTEAVWVYALGIPLFIAVNNLRKRGVKVFTSPVHARAVSTGKTAAAAESGQGPAAEEDKADKA